MNTPSFLIQENVQDEIERLRVESERKQQEYERTQAELTRQKEEERVKRENDLAVLKMQTEELKSDHDTKMKYVVVSKPCIVTIVLLAVATTQSSLVAV